MKTPKVAPTDIIIEKDYLRIKKKLYTQKATVFWTVVFCVWG